MSCARFSPTTGMPAAARIAMPSSETYFVAATMVTRSPTSSTVRAYRSRTASGDVRDHSLAAGAASVAPVGEEAVAVARRAGADARNFRAAGGAKRALDARPEVELPVCHDVRAERLAKRRRHLLA